MYRIIAAAILAIAAVSLPPPAAHAQMLDDELKVFGFFQARFFSEQDLDTQEQISSFSLQQIDLMLQRDISTRWRAFVDFAMVNSYSSELGWGNFNIEEAWVRYRRGRRLNVKMGLLVPTFNRFNSIKNRMPLHPYIVRPLVYEQSLAEVLPLEVYVPRRAYVEVDGTIQKNRIKLDYAVYLGNSPMVSSSLPGEQVETGVDTTDAGLVGGRIGLRYKDTQFGISATATELNFNDLAPGVADSLGVPMRDFEGITQTRFGADFYTRLGPVQIEAEYIDVKFHEDVAVFDADRQFFYGTVGYHVNDHWFFYVSYWDADDIATPDLKTYFDYDYKITSLGGRYFVNDRVTFKLQFGGGDFKADNREFESADVEFEQTTFAVSVFF